MFLSLVKCAVLSFFVGLGAVSPSSPHLDHTKNAISTISNNNVTYSYNTNEVILSNFSTRYDNGYQYTLIGENYIYQSTPSYDSSDELYYIFKNNRFEQNNWLFGYIDICYSYIATGEDTNLLFRLYFCRREANLRYYVDDSLFSYFFDNNFWGNGHYVYLPQYLSVNDLVMFNDMTINSVAGSTSIAITFSLNGTQDNMYYPCNDIRTLHSIEDDYYPYNGSGYNYYDDTNVCIMNNIFSLFVFEEDLLDILDDGNQYISYSYVTTDYLANGTYNDGYRDGFNDGDDSGYTEGYNDGRQFGYNEGYDQGYEDIYDSAFEEGYGEGHTDGYDDGHLDGYTDGYQVGYAVGFNDSDNIDDTALTIFTGIIDVGLLPINVFLGIFNFSVFGINIAGFVSALLTVAIVVIIIRVITGAKND